MEAEQPLHDFKERNDLLALVAKEISHTLWSNLVQVDAKRFMFQYYGVWPSGWAMPGKTFWSTDQDPVKDFVTQFKTWKGNGCVDW